MLEGGGAAGVAEVQAGVDILGIVGDGLGLHLVLIIHTVHHDFAAHRDQIVEGRLRVVVGIQRDARALQRVGHGADGHLDGILLPVRLNADGERALNVQGSKVAAERSVVDVVALLGLNAGKVHHAGRVTLSRGEDHLPRTVGVGDVSQAQIRGGHSQREHKARRHDAERQHTVRDCMAAVRDCFFKFDGSDTRQLLSFHHFGSGSRMQASIAPRAGSTRLCSGRLRTEFHFIFVNFYTLQRLLVR